jgi:hypothetical protein
VLLFEPKTVLEHVAVPALAATAVVVDGVGTGTTDQTSGWTEGTMVAMVAVAVAVAVEVVGGAMVVVVVVEAMVLTPAEAVVTEGTTTLGVGRATDGAIVG